MKWLRLIMVGALLGLGVSVFIKVYSTAHGTCNAQYNHDITLHIGGNLIAAETARTDAQREKGLSGRACIGNNQAMLFVFNKPDYYPFWMKDMKFPIDMVWINPEHKVVTIKANVSPSSYPNTFKNSAPAQYVLEVKSGQAKKLGIKQGTRVNF